MNTPSHAIANLAILITPTQPQATIAIVLGAVLPDVPMFFMYFWAKIIRRQSETRIWTEIYFSPFWQNMTHGFHSIPLILMGIVVTYYLNCGQMEMILLSALLHCLGDLPVHHDDAHRHFYPFSNYRFISPISYWDIKHHGKIVALIKKLLVFIASIYIFPLQQSLISKGLIIAVNLIYMTLFLYFRVFKRFHASNSVTFKQ
ncbi:hypothetical protein NIES4101_56240 [Calothrix sp. NIES-4101]|nr:hypothetical protein NIES4101_56240 [Calothrix sp. NIES-4101]